VSASTRPRARWPAPPAVLWAPVTGRSAGHVLSSVVLAPVLFAVTLAFVLTAWVTTLVWVGIPLLLVAAALIRGMAHLERQRAGLLVDPSGEPDEPAPPAPPAGMLEAVRRAWSDPLVGRACAYLLVLWIPLFVADVVALSLWLAALAGVTAPLWYRYVPMEFPNGETAHGLAWGWFPNGPHGDGGIGLWVGDLPAALLAAGLSLVLLVGASYVLIAAARLHSGAARALLGPPVDPLAGARAVLERPGPLGPLGPLSPPASAP
jgi:hypothetical protein